MKKWLLCGLVGLFASLSGCSMITVNTDYYPKADFASVKTFNWLHPKQAKEKANNEKTNTNT